MATQDPAAYQEVGHENCDHHELLAAGHVAGLASLNQDGTKGQKETIKVFEHSVDRTALFNPKTSILIQKYHPYTGNPNRGTSGDSKNVTYIVEMF